MVNANIVISLSAILVAVVLTIVFVLRKNSKDIPSDNFSVSADGVTEDGGAASMYFCVGQSCQFYDMDYELHDFPGYFALVGFTKEGETFVTEHSVGFTFQFDADGKLVKCYDSASLDGALVASRVDDLLAANKGGDATYTVDGVTWSGGVKWSTDLTVSPSVLGFIVPTPKECKIANSVPGVDWIGGDFGPEQGFDPTFDPSPGRRLNAAGAQLQSTSWSLDAAAAAYDGVAGHNQVIEKSCISHHPSALNGILKGSAVARFIRDKNSNTLALAFAGSDDYYDWVMDLTTERPECDTWYERSDGDYYYYDDDDDDDDDFHSRSDEPPSYCVCTETSWGWDNCRSSAVESSDQNLHWGFFAYQQMLSECINLTVEAYMKKSIDVDMIIGHSLGGAAATIYKRLNAERPGIKTAMLSTWAAPKTTKVSSCSQPGVRYFDEKDPVASNGMGLMKGFNHDVKNAKKGNFDGKYVTTASCEEIAGGCNWFFDCAFYAATRHLISNYEKYNW
jgi:hypothetical protein